MLRKTGRKLKRPSAGGTGFLARRGASSATMIQAAAAERLAQKKAIFQPPRLASRSAQAKESAPEMPMLAAWPAVARDICFAST